MKKNFLSKMTKAFAISGALFLSLGTFNSCSDDDDNVNNSPYTVSGNATSAQMVPAGTGTGTGTFTGTYNPANKTLTYNTGWNGLTGAPNGGGLYSGASGVNGTAVGTPWTFGAGATGTGTSSGTMTLTGQQESQLLNGGWYYSYGTAANTSGEIRGQLTAVR